ncbi:MAG TPA: HPr family phosphocarrier protein [Bacteriovoracaceae bacterium]|nr:HPr family phosphocarrier protein [Bacteriovoracaceae bacterium]
MEKTFKILNEEGMHARPAGAFVKTANEFKSAVEVKANGMTKNGKSIMGLMSMGLSKDSEIVVTTKGEDEEAALSKLGLLIENKFQI